METLELIYSFQDVVSMKSHEITIALERVRQQAARRELMFSGKGSNLFAIIKKEPKMEIDDSCSSVNLLWGFDASPMVLISASRTYENAHLPLPAKVIEKWDDYSRWRNGECYLRGVKTDEFECTITCLPTKSTVTVDLDIEKDGDKDAYRRAFLDILWRIEKMIALTRSATQLIKAFRTVPKKDGFVSRSIKELFAAIGDVL